MKDNELTKEYFKIKNYYKGSNRLSNALQQRKQTFSPPSTSFIIPNPEQQEILLKKIETKINPPM